MSGQKKSSRRDSNEKKEMTSADYQGGAETCMFLAVLAFVVSFVTNYLKLPHDVTYICVTVGVILMICAAFCVVAAREAVK